MTRMTLITEAQLAAMRDAAANEPDANSAVLAILALVPGITIQRGPPEEMVKLAREATKPGDLVEGCYDWERGYVAAQQHVEQALRDAPAVSFNTPVVISRAAMLKRIGAEQ